MIPEYCGNCRRLYYRFSYAYYVCAKCAEIGKRDYWKERTNWLKYNSGEER